MKRKLIILRRVFTTGFKNLIRNSWLSVAAIAVMIVAIMIILSSFVINVATRNIIVELSKNIKISVYLVNDSKDSDIKSLQADFKANPYVDSVTYISQQDAQKTFMASNKNDQQLLQGIALVGNDSVPASVEVSVKDLNKINEVGNIAKQNKFAGIVEEVSLGKTDVQKTIDRAAATQKFITKASVIAAGIFAGVSMLIIFNTIRMAIFTRQDEIRTEKLLGATKGYIRGPFLIESSIYGIISGVVATTAVLAAAYALSNKVATQQEFDTTRQFFNEPLVICAMYGASVGFGMVVGVSSSIMAMSKYLRFRHW
jgi:cell division transport system permease protein